MYEIAVSGVRLYGFHGVSEAERQTGRQYTMDLVMSLALEPGSDDALDGIVDYGEAVQLAAQAFEEAPARTLEHLVGRVGARLLARFDQLAEVKVVIAKLHPPVGRICDSSSVAAIFKKNATQSEPI